MLKQIVVLTFLALTAFAAQAENAPLETCKIDSSLELTQTTQIFCGDDLVIADGVEISTNGFGLQIVALGRVRFGTANGLGLNITAKAVTAGKVFIYARTASGQLNIDNKAADLGADVEIEYGSTYRYTQTTDAGRAAEVRTYVNGQALPL